MAESKVNDAPCDEATAVLRAVNGGQNVAVTLAAGPPELPTLAGPDTPSPFGTNFSVVHVPGYEILRELGRGGMGVVYLARQRKLNRLVALKMALARQYACPEDQIRFRQEVEAVAKLNHPNIAQVYEVGEHDGITFAAFEYVDGGTLQAWQKETPVEPHTAARLLATIARAVQHAHDHGIVHRDLKPANILLMQTDPAHSNETRTEVFRVLPVQTTSRAVGPQIVPKVTDFGLAKRLDGESDLTATGMACGTPNYMAPEQIRGRRGQIGPEADVYGLGAILFELLAARPPFRGESPLLTMQEVLDEPAPSLKKLRPELPHDLAVIVAKCLEKNPVRRYSSAAALADDLERFLEHRPILARGVSRVERAARWVRRNPWAAGLIAALSAACAAMLALAVVLSRSVDHERRMRDQVEDLRREAQAERQLAISARMVAERERQEAENSAKIADAERHKAQQQAQRAANALELATDSIDTVLASFATDPRFQAADFVDIRRDLLLQATRLYASLKRQTADTTGELEHRSLRAQYYLGLLWRTTGNIEKGTDLIGNSCRRFETLMTRFPDRPRWLIEYANMKLDELDHAQQDGTLPRMNAAADLEAAQRSLETAERLRGELREAEQFLLRRTQARWQVQNAMVVGLTAPERQHSLALNALPEVEALLLQNPRDPDATELYGRLLLQLARSAAVRGDPIAACFFEMAEEHYSIANDITFASNRITRWYCRFALARQAHGLYLDSIGRHELANQCFVVTREILERAINATPEIAPYRMDLAEAYLDIIRRTRRLKPDWDPVQMVDTLDFRLAPFWNLGMPTDRARRVLVESKLLLGEWCEERGLYRDAGEVYTNAVNALLHHFQPGEGGAFREQANTAALRAAYMFALAGETNFALARLNLLDYAYVLTGPDWYTLARIWGALALNVPEQAAQFEQNALEALSRADDAGFFRHEVHRADLGKSKALASVRGKYVPRNTGEKEN